MAITVPVIGTEIDVVAFGKPVVDAVNKLSTAASFAYGKTVSQTSTAGQNLISYPTKKFDLAIPLWNGSSFTCPAAYAGLWFLSGTLCNPSATTESMNVSLLINGQQIAWQQFPNSNYVPMSVAVSAVWPMSAGNVFSVSMYTGNAGVPLGGNWESIVSGSLVAQF